MTAMKMTTPATLLSALLLAGGIAATSAQAASVGSTKIASIIVTEGNAFIYPVGQLTDFAACATYGSTVNRLAINTSTAQGRAMLSAALAAQLANKTVGLVGRKTIGGIAPADQCNVQGGDETLFYIDVKNN